MHHFNVKYSKFPGCGPQTPHLPPQNGIEELPKRTILGLKFQNFLGVVSHTPKLRAPKCTILRLKFQNFPGVAPQTPHLPTSNGMEQPPKCTILKFKCQNFPPQTSPPPEPTTPCLTHGAVRRANTPFARRKSKFAPSIFNLDNLVV